MITKSTAANPLHFFLQLARAQAALVKKLDTGLGNLHGLSFADFQLLFHLQRAPGGRLRRVDLADCLALTASGVTRCLLPLEKIGLVTREADPRDARVGYAAITKSGKTLFKHAEASAQNLAAELLKNAPPANPAEVTALLAHIGGLHLD